MSNMIDVNQLATALAGLAGGGQQKWGSFPQGYKNAPSTPGVPFLHGPGGLFGVAGIERDIFSSHINGEGLASMLPVMTSVQTNPLYGYITGFQDSSGSQPDPDTDPCGAFPVAGAIKNCLQTAQFGRYGFETRAIDLNRLGEVINRGEFMDLRIVNSPLVNDFATGLFGNLPGAQADVLARDFMSRLIEVGVAFQRELGEQVFTGTGTGNEFPGLDILVGTNKVDALTGTDCPALDSDLKNFNYGCVDDTTLSSGIVRTLHTMYRYVKYNATHMNFGTVSWVFVMNPNLFYELADVWPCQYNTDRCEVIGDNARVFVDGDAQRRFSDEMRNGSFLLIDGQRIPVIQDPFIVEESSGTPGANLVDGQFASDIYLLPMTVRGGTPVTFWEVFNYANDSLSSAISGGRLTQDFWSDGGRFLWHKEPPTQSCVQWNAQIRPRVILRTPQLAGRLQNVCYEPLQHFRDVKVDDYYMVNGGITTERAAPSYYSDWNLPA